MNLLSILGVIVTSIVSIWATMKFIILKQYRIDDNLSKIMINKIKTSAKWNVELDNEFSINKKFPAIYKCFTNLNGIYMFFNRTERLLNAGWQSKETICDIYFLRWQKKKLEKFIIKNANDEDNINIMLLMPYYTDKLGELTGKNPTVFLDDHVYGDIEADIQDMLENNKSKTGCLLYGPPGNGKTRLVKYFAEKYRLPIYTIYFNPDFTNTDILMLFSSIPERCIVLMEDFDNYFDKRECIMKNNEIKFTFDAIINSLDGVYNDYKQVLFIMTANDINKIDDSIKHRSSRFKFVREITAPSYEKRFEILERESLAKLTEGMTLDKVFFAQSLNGKYSDEEIMEKINLNV